MLKAKILSKGGVLDEGNELPLEIENEFLERVLKFEKAVPVPMYKYLNVDRNAFPPEKELSEEEIIGQFDRLEQLLNTHNIFIELQEGLPLRLAYKHIVEEALQEEHEFVEGFALHLDGCDGYCPGCFQADYCSVKDEIWTEEEIEKERKKNRPTSE